MTTVNDQLSRVTARLSELLAPQREQQKLEAEKRRLEAELATQQTTDTKAARAAALHAASVQKHKDIAAALKMLVEALPVIKQVKVSVDAEGRLMDVYWPGEAVEADKIISGVEWAIEQLDPDRWARF